MANSLIPAKDVPKHFLAAAMKASNGDKAVALAALVMIGAAFGAPVVLEDTKRKKAK